MALFILYYISFFPSKDNSYHKTHNKTIIIQLELSISFGITLEYNHLIIITQHVKIIKM